MSTVEGLDNGTKKRGRKPRKSPEVSVEKVEWRGYINATLTEAQKSGYRAWRNDKDIFQNSLDLAVRDGYKLSVNWYARENAFQASLYCQNPDYPEAGFCLSQFAGDIDTATHKLIYIHSVVLKGDWTPLLKKSLVDTSW